MPSATVEALPGSSRGALARLRAAASGRRIARSADAILSVRTVDGWSLRVMHYRPVEGAPVQAEPAVLCHGFCMNSHCFDLVPPWSMARHLAACGFHVFVPDLRGRRRSFPAVGTKCSPHDYSFDHHALADAPAVLDAALESTGAQRAFWVGHSMGGLVGYVLAAWRPESLAGLAVLGAPVVLRPDPFFGRLLRLAASLPMDPVPQRALAVGLAPVAGAFPFLRQVSSLLVDADRSLLRVALSSLVEDMGKRITRQMAHWMATGRFLSEDGRTDYAALLPSLRLPLLVLAASGDRLAPPATVRAGFDAAGAADRTWLCLGRDLGDEHHAYGHGDFLIGRDAPVHVYPVLARWLARRASPARLLAPAAGAAEPRVTA